MSSDFNPTSPQPWAQPTWQQRTQYLLDSYERYVGKPLIVRSGVTEDSERLFKTSFVVVAHGTEDDPLLNYGNQAALDLWQLPLKDLIGMPSRKTAEPVHRDERAQLLARTRKYGFIDDYTGIRIAATGTRFRIHKATVWNVLNEKEQHVGQAATFGEWTEL